MTGREIERMEKSLPRWQNGVPPVLTVEQQRLSKELDCRGMINSILIYEGIENVRENSYWYGQYLKKYEKDLGRDCVVQLCQEQVEDFRKACVYYGGRDGEGLSYNSILWADEIVDAVIDRLEYDLAAEGPENGTGYTLPDGKYHIFAYVDFVDDTRVIVLEPNKVVDGAHEPIWGDTYILPFGNVNELRKGIEWCLEQFASDRYGIDAVLADAKAKASECKNIQKEHEVDIL